MVTMSFDELQDPILIFFTRKNLFEMEPRAVNKLLDENNPFVNFFFQLFFEIEKKTMKT